MIILVAESKTMAAGNSVPPSVYKANMPVMEREAATIMRSLAGMTVQDLARNVRISIAMARRLQQMIIEFDDKTSGLMAIEAYTGVVFRALDVATLDIAGRTAVGNRVRIISSLYGWLRPDDIVKSYRFDFTTRLAPGGTSFAAYWRDAVTDCLIREIVGGGCGEVLDLLPGDASKCIDWKRVAAEADVYKADFVEACSGGKWKTPDSNRLKSLRGQLLRQIVSEDICDAGDLAAITGDNYMAEPSMHRHGHLSFVTAR